MCTPGEHLSFIQKEISLLIPKPLCNVKQSTVNRQDQEACFKSIFTQNKMLM